MTGKSVSKIFLPNDFVLKTNKTCIYNLIINYFYLLKEPVPSMWCEVAGWGSQEPSKEPNDINQQHWLADLFNVHPQLPDISIGMPGGDLVFY